MAYELVPADKKEIFLCFRLSGDGTERCGAIGYLRADFGRSGREFHTTWFDSQPHLKSSDFKYKFDELINSLRDDGQKPLFASRDNHLDFCAAHPSMTCFKIATLDYSFYIRLNPIKALMIFIVSLMIIAGSCPNWRGNTSYRNFVTAQNRTAGSLYQFAVAKTDTSHAIPQNQTRKPIVYLLIPLTKFTALQRHRRKPCLPEVCSAGAFLPPSRGITTKAATPAHPTSRKRMNPNDEMRCA